MIDPKCFTAEWIQQKSNELGYADRNLIEKVIRAMSLLDMLAASGCPFVFKGGSCLMLLLHGKKHRLSIDIDIICPPEVNIEDYLTRYQECGFIDYKLIERKQTIANVPKSHSKFFYQIAYRSGDTKPEYILLDVLHEHNQYLRTQTVPILTDMTECQGEPLLVQVPSIDDILGDKMTAFAPETTGVPYYRRDTLMTLEIIKQLYDVGRLFDNISDTVITTQSFRRIAPIEMGYRGMTGDVNLIFDDIRNTALNIATRGWVDKQKFGLLQQGIKRVSSFMYQGNYYIEDAITDAAKAAYLATLIQKNQTQIERYEHHYASAPELTIGASLTNKLNKLRSTLPEAFFYWAKTSELLER